MGEKAQPQGWDAVDDVATPGGEQTLRRAAAILLQQLVIEAGPLPQRD